MFLEDESISRRRFLGGATTAGAVALSGLALAENAAAEKTPPGPSGNDALPPAWFEGPDPSIPKAGLRWAFSARCSLPTAS
ncbi:MAG: twin-arginine translocation signal domain-containing protein [Steroidobacteraceae bacterium]